MKKRTANEELAICERVAVMWLHGQPIHIKADDDRFLLDQRTSITARQLARFIYEQREAARSYPDSVDYTADSGDES
jgi:hypothetical protein